ncbi:MAG TPA: toll/interleukin-1 receptor domain-containing protein [Thermoanaerobaculia bacterium]|nr:toll/interleukin-1 receptor domain-containing protein [Thermoanaerobaculia bacterium]
MSHGQRLGKPVVELVRSAPTTERSLLDTLVEKITPPSLDPRALLRDHLRLASDLRTYLQDHFARRQLELVEDKVTDKYAPIDRPITLVRGRGLDVPLLQIPRWIVANGENVGSVDEIRTAFENRSVRVVSPGCDAASLALGRMFTDWRARYQIGARFVAWNHLRELERGFDVLDVFDLRPVEAEEALPAAAPPGGPVVVRNQVFISYSHLDSPWLDRLKVHLKPLLRGREPLVWDDSRIQPGDEWRREIEEGLRSAKVAVLLVSKNFLASDFIDKNELPPILAASQGRMRILWALLGACNWDVSPVAKYEAAYKPLERLDGLDEPDQEEILQKISRLIADQLDTE